MTVARAYIGIGSNLDDPIRQVRSAITALRAVGAVVAASSLYRTAPWGKTEQPEFVNAAVALDTRMAPRQLLHALKWLERDLGRDEPHERWGPRRIDFDILAYGDQRVDEDDLVIPHPRLRERAFALVPLAEIAPQYAPLRDALPAAELAGVSVIG
ncbi:MAG TPA: 2-amino-4-hydroxy-6-hydroxymethyldihydropteridine diphosphokinase [Candidatus Acidoferrales bacterium]|nr:2-amino-4-hydroxy-6-hydroxymethyldihydropteridine diphosphokinase [Candidatus Acidoferrales bacterium]